MVALRTREVAEGHFFFLFGCAAHAANLVAQDAARQTFFDQARCASLFITVFVTRSSSAHALRAAVRVRTPDANVGTWRSCSRARWAAHAVTIRAVAANLPALRHALLENSRSPEPVWWEGLVVPFHFVIGLTQLAMYAGVFLCATSLLIGEYETRGGGVAPPPCWWRGEARKDVAPLSDSEYWGRASLLVERVGFGWW